MIQQRVSLTLNKFPVITKGEAQNIEYRMRFMKGIRKTIELNGLYYDIQSMTDEEAEKVWNELHINE